MTISGTYAVYGDSQCECVFWNGNNYIGQASGTALTTSSLKCTLPTLSSLADGTPLKVTVHVWRSSAQSNLNDCYSSKGSGPSSWVANQYASFVYYAGVECNQYTIPTLSGVTPGTVFAGDIFTLSGSWMSFGDTIGTCIYWYGGNSVDSSPALSTPTSTSMSCTVPTLSTVPDGATVQVTVIIYRQSATVPNYNSCYSSNGAGPGSWSSQQYRNLVYYGGIECNTISTPVISYAGQNEIYDPTYRLLTIYGTFTLFSDSNTFCLFWVNDVLTLTTNPNDVGSSYINCDVPSSFAGVNEGDTVKVTIYSYRTAASNHFSSLCYSQRLQAPNSWTSTQYVAFTWYSGVECNGWLTPSISAVETPSSVTTGESLTLTGSLVPTTTLDYVANCLFWSDDSNFILVPATITSTNALVCTVPGAPSFNVADGTTVRVTVQAYRSSAASSGYNQFCYSHLLQSYYAWNSNFFLPIIYYGGIECNPLTVPTLFSINPTIQYALKSVSLDGASVTGSDVAISCIYWVNDTYPLQDNTVGSFVGTTIDCPVPLFPDEVADGSTILVTLQVYKTEATQPNNDYCFTNQNQYSFTYVSSFAYQQFTYIKDIDECSNPDLNDCHKDSTCQNKVGGFTCSCNSGFTGDGVQCKVSSNSNKSGSSSVLIIAVPAAAGASLLFLGLCVGVLINRRRKQIEDKDPKEAGQSSSENSIELKKPKSASQREEYQSMGEELGKSPKGSLKARNGAAFRTTEDKNLDHYQNIYASMDNPETAVLNPPMPVKVPAKTDLNNAEPKDFEVDFGDLEFVSKIGEGAYGEVWMGRWRKALCAIKKIKNVQSISTEQLKDFEAEAALMKKLRPHPNLVLFLGLTKPPNLCIVTEFVNGGTLLSLLHSHDSIPFLIVAKIIKGISHGMYHLHQERIVHRDLACRNVLLSKDNEPKITDFGMSRHTGSSNTTKSDVGPLKWMAPESLESKVYSSSTDSWSFAIVLIEIFTRQDPYPKMAPFEAAVAVTKGYRHEIPPCPPVIASIIKRCFETKPEARPTFSQIVEELEKLDKQ